MLKQVVLLAIVLFMAPSWAVNKCAGEDGKVIFQDAPCSDGAKSLSAPSRAPVSAQPPAVMSASDVARSFESQIERPEMQKKIQANIETRQMLEKAEARGRRDDQKLCGKDFKAQPTVGMSEAQFLNCTVFAREWDYLQVNETETQLGVRKQYVYARHSPVKFIYIDNGKITAVSR
ncbi:DUF4124 domain-containing protein [Acidovorax sp. ACV02]|uniref:DUF4124 domain-containing protein n=1 Tax=Acidovorax sp. ACV02 TaxID=2769310 RepID=UPI001784A66A|nr:DUF4124 domain-containing protein [Acidovorax sp. ACV02]MBD9405413.1 DUF4124 domain-containing protein [Acidovorax sp. ACV02]